MWLNDTHITLFHRLQLLFQERNPGLRYEYTITRDAENTNEITPPVFYWEYGTWTPCTATCGTGKVRLQIPNPLPSTVTEHFYSD